MRRPRRDGMRVLLFERFGRLEFDLWSVVCTLIRWYSMKYINCLLQRLGLASIRDNTDHMAALSVFEVWNC